MKHRAALFVYLAAIVLLTSIHDYRFLAAALAAVALLSWKDAPRIARRTVRAVLPFNAVVTLSYLLFSRLAGDFQAAYIVRMNLRVLALSSCTFLFVSRVDPFRAFSFSPSLLYLLTLAYGQTAVFRRLFEDFRLAFRSRSPARARTVDLYRHAGATGAYFLGKALHDSTEIADAMRSRGYSRDSA